MKTVSLSAMKLKLEKACAALRPFTLGYPGITQENGIAGIRQVLALCSQIKKAFGDGPEATQAAQIASSGRACVLAAEARLAVLGRKTIA